jgi:protein TonB
MQRTDWIGLGTSLALHALLALLLALLSASRTPPQQLGYVEVEFGEFASGRPVEAVDEAPQATQPEAPETPPKPTPEPDPEPQQPDPEPEPVDVPEETPPEDETVPPTEEETVPPEPSEQSQPEAGADAAESEDETGEQEADPGEGTQDEKAAPYNIEGLDRDPLRAPLPSYDAQVNARIRVRITVDAQGRITGVLPLMKGNPDLEASVRNALQNWRFNPLPPGAPQELQTGTITFVFRLE